MDSKPLVLFAALVAAAATMSHLSTLSFVGEAWAACDPGTPIDKTTVEETRSKLIKAGYQSPGNLRKGCDNTWHGTAIKDGAEVNVAVLPDGHIVRDGD